MTSVSVIIPTHAREERTRTALASLRKQDYLHTWEVCVVDNAGSAALAELIRREAQSFPVPLRCVREPRVGLHHARHAGALAAIGEVLAYLDDDVLVPAGWLSALAAPYADPNVMAVGGKVIPRWEEEPPAWVHDYLNYLSVLDLGEESTELRPPQTLHGCNFSVRKTELWAVGGFHPDAFADRRLIWYRGDGESGLVQELLRRGHKVIYEPRAWVYHCIPSSRTTLRYMARRVADEAITGSYKALRERRYTAASLLVRAPLTLLRFVKHRLRLLLTREGGPRVQCQLSCSAEWTLFQHRIRYLASADLRRHIHQETYLISPDATGVHAR